MKLVLMFQHSGKEIKVDLFKAVGNTSFLHLDLLTDLHVILSLKTSNIKVIQKS